MNCAFTGHRVLNSDFDVNLLDRVILNLIKSGVNNFYCGMAKGFDIVAAESVLQYKKNYDINLFACIPCTDQQEHYSLSDKNRYDRIIKRCDGEIILSNNYYVGCMYERDRFLVDNSDILVSYLRIKKGGTYYTVNYAKKNGIKIIEL